MIMVEIRGLHLEKMGTQPYIILKKGLSLRFISTFISDSRTKHSQDETFFSNYIPFKYSEIHSDHIHLYY